MRTSRRGFHLASRIQLDPWQVRAVAAWDESEAEGFPPRHGIFDIYTGAGKTVAALAAMALVSDRDPGARFVIVVPTVALVKQWVDAFSFTTLSPDKIGVVRGRRRDILRDHVVLICVINTVRARTLLGSVLRCLCRGFRVMLVVDECHRAGSASNSQIFDARTRWRLGLSATPVRTGPDDVDFFGEPLDLTSQRHGRALGPVCFRLTLKDGHRLGLLPRFRVYHHGISLTNEENDRYGWLTTEIDKARVELLRCGGKMSNYLFYINSRRASQSLRFAAREVQRRLLIRKNFLFHAKERLRVACVLLQRAWFDSKFGPPVGVLLFNERIGRSDGTTLSGAEALYDEVVAMANGAKLPIHAEEVAMEHSGLPKRRRAEAIRALKEGQVKVLVTVKALQEGIDVPNVDMGISVASTSSARQRIQTMGRILRPARYASGRRVPRHEGPMKRLHLIYIQGTTDEEIYRQSDWNEATGADHNEWLVWDEGALSPKKGPPLRVRPRGFRR